MPSPDKSIHDTPEKLPQFLATIIVNLCAFSYGSAMGWITTSLPVFVTEETSIGPPLDSTSASWLASLMILIGGPATLLFGYLCEQYGCKISGYICGVGCIVHWLLVIFANHVHMLYVARIIIGFSAGGSFIICCVYVQEIAHESLRGSLGVFVVIFVFAGIQTSYILGAIFEYWIVSYICLVYPIVFFVLFYRLPESPVFLLKKGKEEYAKSSLQWLRGKTYDITTEWEYLKSTVKNKSLKSTAPVKFSELFATKGTRLACFISFALTTNQHLAGYYVVLTYTVLIFDAAGSNISPYAATVIVGFMQMLGNVLSGVFIDRVGRKLLLVISDIFACLAMAGMGAYFYAAKTGMDVSSVSFIPLLCLSVFIISTALGLMSVPYVVLSELFLPRIRPLAYSIAVTYNWLLAFLVTRFFSDVSEVIGEYGCYWLFSGSCLLGCAFIIFFLPETKGRSLESIQLQLEGK